MLNSKFRIRVMEYKMGFAVEVKVNRFMGSKWVNIVSFAGLDDCPFYYSSKQRAINDVVKLIEWKLLSS